jgi:glycosyltransferase involved in cell wall biosynthesis
MRIALVAPLAEAVPPKLYGGTERVVSWLAEELVRQAQGHLVHERGVAHGGNLFHLGAATPQTCGNPLSPWQHAAHVAGGGPARQ